MENNDLCFYIEGDGLCLECVLEEYMGVPILFCCKGKEDQRYLALCTDFKEFHYIVAKISLVELHSLMVKQISLRDALLNQPEYWNIISGEDTSIIFGDIYNGIKKILTKSRTKLFYVKGKD